MGRPYDGPPNHQGRYGPPPYYSRDGSSNGPPPHGMHSPKSQGPHHKDSSHPPPPPQSPGHGGGAAPPHGVGGPGGAFTPPSRKGGSTGGYGGSHPYYPPGGQQSSSVTVVSPGSGPQPPPPGSDYRNGPPYSPRGSGYYPDGRGPPPRDRDHSYNRPSHEGGYSGSGYGGDRGYHHSQGPPPPPHSDGYGKYDGDRYGGGPPPPENSRYMDYPPGQRGPPSSSYHNRSQGPPPGPDEHGYTRGPPSHDSRYPSRDGPSSSNPPPYPPSSGPDYHGGNSWDAHNRPPPHSQSDDPNTYHHSGGRSQRNRGSRQEHGASGFTRAVSNSFAESSVKSRSEKPPRETDDDAASDSSWRQLKQVASVDDAQMQARIHRTDGDDDNRNNNRRSKEGSRGRNRDHDRDREMATTTPTPQVGTEVLPHPNSNASSLSTSPSESRENHPVVDVRGAPSEVQYPQLPTPSKLMSLNSLSSVASIQEPIGTAEDTGSLSGNVNVDLMQCGTGSGSLLFNAKDDNLNEDNPGANGSTSGSTTDSREKKRNRESRGDGETSNTHKDGSDEIRRAPSDIKDPQFRKKGDTRSNKRSRHRQNMEDEEEKKTVSHKSSDKKRKSKGQSSHNDRPSTPVQKYKTSPPSMPSSPPFTPGGMIQIPSSMKEDENHHPQGERGLPSSLYPNPPPYSSRGDRRGPNRTGSFGSPTFYDRTPSYGYSIDSVPSFPKEGENGYDRPYPPGPSSGPSRVESNDTSSGPPPSGVDKNGDIVPSALSWEIQGQDSFCGGMTVASNGTAGEGGAQNLLSSFSFGNDYQMLAKSSSNVGRGFNASPANVGPSVGDRSGPSGSDRSGPGDRNSSERGMSGPPGSYPHGGPPQSGHPSQHGGAPPPQGPPSQHYNGRSGPSMPESRNQSFDQSRGQSFDGPHGPMRSRAESFDPYGGPPPHHPGSGPHPSAGPDGYKPSGQRNGPPPPHSSHHSSPPNGQFPPHSSSWGTSTSHPSQYSSSSGNQHRHPGHPPSHYSGSGGPGAGGPPGMGPHGGSGYSQYRGGPGSGGRPHSPQPHGGPGGPPPMHHHGGPPPPHHRQYPHGPNGMMRNYSEDSRMSTSSPPPLHHRGGHNSWGGPPPPDRHHPGWGPPPDHRGREPHNLPNAFQPPPPEFSNGPPHMTGKRPPPTVYIVSSQPGMRGVRGPHGGDPSLMSKNLGTGVYGWSKDDDAWLTEIMKKYKNPRDWEPIAKQHGRGKTAKECHERWIRYLKPGVRKGQWQDHEDAIVVEAVSTSSEQPFTRWSDLAQRLPGRVGKQIRDRWVNHLNPAINHMPFSREDDLLLWEGHKKLGKRWVEISTKYFNSTRSENHIKNRWYSASFKKFIANEFGPDAYAGKMAESDRKDKMKNEDSDDEEEEEEHRGMKIKNEESPSPPPISAATTEAV